MSRSMFTAGSRRALSALFILVLTLNGAALAEQQASDLPCNLDDAVAAAMNVQPVESEGQVLCLDGGIHLDGGHCCHAGGHFAALTATCHKLGVVLGFEHTPIVDAHHDRSSIAPPVPPPNI